MLRRVQNLAARKNLDERGSRLDGFKRHVFKLEGDDIDAAREFFDRVQILVIGGSLKIGDLSGRRVGRGRKRVDAIAHLAGFDGKHAPELTAAENADGRIW
jgi:hypothetical protein